MTKSEMKKGYPIVLTASRAEMSRYGNNPFQAFICTFPRVLSQTLLRKFLHPESDREGIEIFAPYGLRKVESMLREAFGEESVVVAHYENLHRFIGENTRIVGISTMDPLGLAYVSTTYNSLIGFGGESLNSLEFKRLMDHPYLRHFGTRIIVGGAGVWQIRDAGLRESFGIDVLFQGEGEQDLVPVIRKMLHGEKVPGYYVASKPVSTTFPLIRKAASYGMVEITRGCGRGCKFCSINARRKTSIPLEDIMREVKVNISNGSRSIFTATDDMFLYGSGRGFIPDREAIVNLYRSIARYPGVDHIILSHASLAPVIYDPRIIEELTPILMEKTLWTPEIDKYYKEPFITVEVGIETGSSRLMKKNMPGKALPFSVDNWSESVIQGIGLMNDHGWWPLCTFLTGQPDETEEDVIATLELLDELRAHNAKIFYTPLVFIPLEDAIHAKEKRPSLENLTELQWEAITRSWKNNIDFWRPELKWIYNPMLFLSHWFYARWRHGKKATIPMMHLCGFPDTFIRMRVGKSCDRDYCNPEPDTFKSRVQDVFSGFIDRRGGG